METMRRRGIKRVDVRPLKNESLSEAQVATVAAEFRVRRRQIPPRTSFRNAANDRGARVGVCEGFASFYALENFCC